MKKSSKGSVELRARRVLGACYLVAGIAKCFPSWESTEGRLTQALEANRGTVFEEPTAWLLREHQGANALDDGRWCGNARGRGTACRCGARRHPAYARHVRHSASSGTAGCHSRGYRFCGSRALDFAQASYAQEDAGRLRLCLLVSHLHRVASMAASPMEAFSAASS